MFSGLFILNVDYYVRKIFEELDSIDSGLQKLETGEQPRDWNLYKIIWKLENVWVNFNNSKLFEETKNRMIPIPIWHATFVVQPLSASLVAIISLSALSLMDMVQHLANQCLSLYLWYPDLSTISSLDLLKEQFKSVFSDRTILVKYG